MQKHHVVASIPGNIHWGFFDGTLPPVAEIASGDTVTMHCLTGEPADLPTDIPVLEEHREILVKTPRGHGPRLLTGPAKVAGAKPGQVLQVDILDVQLRQEWGFNLIIPLRGTLPDRFPTFRRLIVPLDRQNKVAKMPWGLDLPLAPFCGVMAVAPPPAWGRITSLIPRAIGGNMDNRELRPGTTLYLPIFVEGALFSAGDGHAAQGDGEVCQTALETSVSGTFRLTVRSDLSYDFPTAETPTHLMTVGLHEDLDDAAVQATGHMVSLIQERAGLTAEDAYTLCSLAMDLRITQCVDGNKGVHALLPKAYLAR